jgi:hypothetical protein
MPPALDVRILNEDLLHVLAALPRQLHEKIVWPSSVRILITATGERPVRRPEQVISLPST